jgi:hypothetical protein
MTEQWTVGQAREYFAKRKPHSPGTGKRKKGKGDKAKAEMELVLKLIGVPYEKEYRFHHERKFRFDFAIPSLKIGIEYEGLMSEKSRHTTVKGYTSDADKYNLAQSCGWRVFRYTALNYTNLTNDLKANL